ncbi:MAG TPA: DUF805 domain-containing protein [Gammaproteobacteria bacterium]|nr:DUF805 domain-containing protein [Gammaproteobacteria bacterium]HRF44780.1 DUF805 domain-containing protein [Candidatus Competibacteraceae bacterium]
MNNPSPYQPPRGAITPTSSKEFGEVKILSAQGRLGRVRYIGYSVGIGLLVNLILALIGGLAAFLQQGGSAESMGMLTGSIMIVLGIAALAVSILLTIQRLHDFNASGWWSVLIIVPLANMVLYLILLIMPGTQGPNRFGNPPPPNTLGVTLLALILPLIFVMGIIAAIAIPAYMDYMERTREATSNSAPLQE